MFLCQLDRSPERLTVQLPDNRNGVTGEVRIIYFNRFTDGKADIKILNSLRGMKRLQEDLGTPSPTERRPSATARAADAESRRYIAGSLPSPLMVRVENVIRFVRNEGRSADICR